MQDTGMTVLAMSIPLASAMQPGHQPALDLPGHASIRPRVSETGTALLPISAGQHQLALIAGLPCSQSYLIADLCRKLFAHRHGDCELLVVTDLTPETVERIAIVTGPVLFLAESADRALVQVARDAEFPIVVLNQRFSVAAHDYVATRGVSPQDAMRTMTRAQIGIEGLSEIPRAAVQEIGSDESALAVIERIAGALAISDGYAALLEADCDLTRPLSEIANEAMPHGYSPHDDDVQEMFRSLEAFYGFHPERSGGVLNVPLAALPDGVPPHLPATGAIDLTGVPRCLTFGPYFHLPKGRWKISFMFHSSGNISSNTLGFEVAVDHEIKVNQYFDVTASGKFAFECEFTVEDPYSSLEFRTYLLRGSIEGEFRPLALTIAPPAEGQSSTNRAIGAMTHAADPFN